VKVDQEFQESRTEPVQCNALYVKLAMYRSRSEYSAQVTVCVFQTLFLREHGGFFRETFFLKNEKSAKISTIKVPEPYLTHGYCNRDMIEGRCRVVYSFFKEASSTKQKRGSDRYHRQVSSLFHSQSATPEF
jgi:hypothetical protein